MCHKVIIKISTELHSLSKDSYGIIIIIRCSHGQCHRILSALSKQVVKVEALTVHVVYSEGVICHHLVWTDLAAVLSSPSSWL